MSIKRKLLVAFAAIFVVGVLMIAFVDTKGPEPDFECAAEGAPTSGFSDSSQGDCPVSIDSYNTWREWYTTPQHGKSLGVVLAAVAVLGSIGVGIASIVGRVRSRR